MRLGRRPIVKTNTLLRAERFESTIAYEHADLAGCIAPQRDIGPGHTTTAALPDTAAPCLFGDGWRAV